MDPDRAPVEHMALFLAFFLLKSLPKNHSPLLATAHKPAILYL
jgi:hypothetical protein